MTTKDINITEWFLIRHAPVREVRKGIYDKEDGEAKLPEKNIIRALARDIPKNALWFVSPLLRTKQTAETLRAEIDKPGEMFFCDPLKEQSFGDWQGLSFEDIWQEIKELPAHNWSLLAADTTPPNGESFNDVQARVSRFIKDINEKYPSRPRVLVTHAGVIRSFIGTALELNNDAALSFGVDPFSLTHLIHQTGNGKGGQWQLKSLNQRYETK
jgi:alpha-ribazole phosphatase